MNYYDVIKGDPSWNNRGSSCWLQCCACTEAYVNDKDGVKIEKFLLDTFARAIADRQTLLHWNLLPSLKSNAKALEIVPFLPATLHIGSYINKRTGKQIHSFVTNLTEEW